MVERQKKNKEMKQKRQQMYGVAEAFIFRKRAVENKVKKEEGKGGLKERERE